MYTYVCLCIFGFLCFLSRCPPEELVEILETVNPANKAGKVTLITRMSSKYLDEHLPKLILAVQKAGLNVSFVSARFGSVPVGRTSYVYLSSRSVRFLFCFFLSAPAPSLIFLYMCGVSPHSFSSRRMRSRVRFLVCVAMPSVCC